MYITTLSHIIAEEAVLARKELRLIMSIPPQSLTVEVLQGCRERAEALHRNMARYADACVHLNPQTDIVAIVGMTGVS